MAEPTPDLMAALRASLDRAARRRGADDDVDLLEAVADPTPEAERIAAVLVDLDRLTDVGYIRTHYDGCWRDPGHGGCLAARIRRTLTGQED